MSQMNGLHGMWGRFTCSETSGAPQLITLTFTCSPLERECQRLESGSLIAKIAVTSCYPAEIRPNGFCVSRPILRRMRRAKSTFLPAAAMPRWFRYDLSQ